MSIKQIEQEIEDLKGIKVLVQTYEEIAATRMQRIKASVLLNREFLDSLYKIYQHVKFSYDKKITRIKQEESKERLESNGKSFVSILLSANTGLYGGIIRDTYDIFFENVKNRKDTDIAVVGKVGKKLIERDKDKLGISDYEYFEIPDGASDPSKFSDLISYIINYDSVDVYHGKFEGLLSQIPVKDNVTGDLPESEKRAVEEAKYIFEPSLGSIVSFFESEIMASIFEQAIFESSLSKHASRMVNLDRAVVNIKGKIEKTNFERQRVHHRNINKKQADLLSSLSLW